jgi:hypothetical protein
LDHRGQQHLPNQLNSHLSQPNEKVTIHAEQQLPLPLLHAESFGHEFVAFQISVKFV